MISVDFLYVIAMVTLGAPVVAAAAAIRGVLGRHLRIVRQEIHHRDVDARTAEIEPIQHSALDNAEYGWRLGVLTRSCSLASLIASIALAVFTPAHGAISFTVLFTRFYLDALSVYFILLVNLVAFFTSWYTVDFLNKSCVGQRSTLPWSQSSLQEKYRPASTEQKAVFHLLFNVFHITMLLVPMVANLVVLWMAIELTTLASTLLVSFRRDRKAVEAAWKYIIITTVGIIFALFGTILLTSAVGDRACRQIGLQAHVTATTCGDLRVGALEFWAPGGDDLNVNLMHWSVLARPEVAEKLDGPFVILSFVFILLGYGTKAGLAPMHTWLPDGHGQAPAPVSALLSGVLLKSALYAILRFLTITNLSDPERNPILTGNLLLAFGLLSLVLATPFILKANPFKRVLAYHSLEHMGIIAFAIGVGGRLALFGALLHCLNHALTKALMFLTFGYVGRRFTPTPTPANSNDAAGVECREIDEDSIRGVLSILPGAGFILLLGGLALVGSPPFNLFLSELIIIWAALERSFSVNGPNSLPIFVYQVAIAMFLITLALIFGGLVRHLGRLLLGGPAEKSWPGRTREGSTGPSEQIWPLVLLLVVILLTGVWVPNSGINLVAIIEQSACIIQKGSGTCVWNP